VKCLSRLLSIFLCFILVFGITGCGSEDLPMQYGSITTNENYIIDSTSEQTQMTLFASDYCATIDDVTNSSTVDYSGLYAAGIYDLNDKEVLYSYQANEHINPASLTKIMTALVVFDNCNLDDIVTIGDVTITEDGVQLFNLQTGDQISVRNLLYITMVYSGNDAALALAQHVAGTEEAFVQMMNDKAYSLGATNTNFTNPHGLSDENHYTSAYDLYLIFRAAVQYDEFIQLINTASYTVNYTHADGEEASRTITSTNKYLTQDYSCPNQISIIGGKTGSTMAAGKCIILYATDSLNNPYICIVMGASDEETLYQTMTQLCEDSIH